MLPLIPSSSAASQATQFFLPCLYEGKSKMANYAKIILAQTCPAGSSRRFLADNIVPIAAISFGGYIVFKDLFFGVKEEEKEKAFDEDSLYKESEQMHPEVYAMMSAFAIHFVSEGAGE